MTVSLSLRNEGQGIIMFLMHYTFSHVFLKGTRHTKWHFTKTTFELVVPHPPMSLHMSCKFAALCTRVRTELTVVRFLPSVTSPVYCQVAAVLKYFSTIFTSIV